MRKALMGGAVAVALVLGAGVGAVQGADTFYEPAPASWSWTGFYAGVQIGHGWTYPLLSAEIIPLMFDGSGFVGGAHAGLSYQWDHLVLGLEADVEASGIKGTLEAGGTTTLTFEQNWLASVRARLGYAVDDVLFYGTAGWAISNIDYSAIGPTETFSDGLTHSGWTAGAGAELAVTDQLTARLEYRYTDFGAETFTIGTESVEVEPHTHAVRAGLSWRF